MCRRSGENRGRAMLIGWENTKDNGEEYKIKEEGTAEQKTVGWTNKERWKRNTVGKETEV
jgi:hypothetical protein